MQAFDLSNDNSKALTRPTADLKLVVIKGGKAIIKVTNVLKFGVINRSIGREKNDNCR